MMDVPGSPEIPPAVPWSLPALAERAGRLAEGRRHLLGLTGPPGAGKSTLAASLCDALGPAAARVSLDGFHLAGAVLADLGLAGRKGSPETFDAGGFQALLSRLRANTEDVVYAPDFFREIEEPIAAALRIPRTVPLIIVEGNYLLLDDGPWRGTAAFFDEVWYLRPDDATRLRRLISRHESYGRSPVEAKAWVLGNDERNARLIATTAYRADRIVLAGLASAHRPGCRRTWEGRVVQLLVNVDENGVVFNLACVHRDRAAGKHADGLAGGQVVT